MSEKDLFNIFLMYRKEESEDGINENLLFLEQA